MVRRARRVSEEEVVIGRELNFQELNSQLDHE